MSKKQNRSKPKSERKPERKHKRLSTDIVLTYLSQRTEPANTKAIAETLGRVGSDGRQETFQILEQLRDEGKVTQLSKHRWAMPQAIKVHRGKVIGHVDGHGFVLTDETKEKIFLRAHDMRGVLHNDIVQVRITGKDRRKRLFGQIIDVLERGNSQIVGRYFNEGGTNFVVPDDQRIGQDIFIMPEHLKGAKAGQVVSVKITKPPSKNFQPVGVITEVLGDYSAPGMEIQIAIRKHNLPHTWSEAVEKQIKQFSELVNEADFSGRKDIRDLPLVTIDGEDARDFDDAVYCQPLGDGRNRLIVAIADVSHYVKPKSPLDTEAFERGNSVYFPQNVIPMLPEVLSNGLCSLKPQVNRLCFACDMQISAEGEIEEYEFYPALMYSHARLTYTQVAELIGNDKLDDQPGEKSAEQTQPSVTDIASELHKPIHDLYALSKRLHKRRQKNGAIEFEIPEPLIVFDEQRKIDKVIARERNDAHRLIEECMLAANICASIILNDSDLTGIYRVHEAPDKDRVNDVRAFLRQFKLLLKGADEPKAKDYAEIVNQVTDPKISPIVQTSLLRSMKQAVYSDENLGHFALNFDSYTHFTSPIRRYADLVVHRQIKRLLVDPQARSDEGELNFIVQTAEQTSTTERRADAATREATQWLKCEFMSHKIGEKLWGTVSSVTDFGLFVELEDFYVDGLIHITSLGKDYYRYDADNRQLRGETNKQVYQMGQRLNVQVSRVDMDKGRIDFELVDVLKQKFTQGNAKRGNSKRSHSKRSNVKQGNANQDHLKPSNAKPSNTKRKKNKSNKKRR